jgi:ABC-type multidrug transport system fused ATPase/permease subunit
LYDDSRLWDALKRAYLVDTDETQPLSPITVTESEQTTSRFDLDTPIDGEGSNLSVGQVEFFLSFFLLVIDNCAAIIGILGASPGP